MQLTPLSHNEFIVQLSDLQNKITELKKERQTEAMSLLQQKKQFLNQYKHILPDEERVGLIRGINQEMKEANSKY